MHEQCSMKSECHSASQLPLCGKQDFPSPACHPSWHYSDIFRKNIFRARTTLCKTYADKAPLNEVCCALMTLFSAVYISPCGTQEQNLLLQLIYVLEKRRKKKSRNSRLWLPTTFTAPLPVKPCSAEAQLPPPCVSWAHCQAGMPQEAQLMCAQMGTSLLPWRLLEPWAGTSAGWSWATMSSSRPCPLLCPSAGSSAAVLPTPA